jgi:DNA-binding response OmpR family regulator
MPKFKNNQKPAPEGNEAANQAGNQGAEQVTFSGGVSHDELELDSHSSPSGAYANDSTPLEHPSEATGVIVVGGAMPEVEVVDNSVSSADANPSGLPAPVVKASNGNHGEAKSEHQHNRPRQSGEDRRKRRRALISAPLRVRPARITDDGPSEVTTTVDVSRSGLLFASEQGNYKVGMEVAVVFPYSAIPGEVYAEQIGVVVRHVPLADGRKGVAICFDKPVEKGDEQLIDSGGRSFLHPDQQEKQATAAGTATATASRPSAPVEMLSPAETTRAKILIVESDERARQTMCSFLNNDGYNAMGVSSAAAARDILADTIPAVVVAEIEGDGMHGYDLCASIKKDERLRRVPVILTTRSAYPSDYANAHAVGAIICMAKPFKQEKLGHMVRLLAPLRKKAHEASGVDSSHGRAKSRLPFAAATKPTTTPRAPYNPDEFRKLCDDAIRERGGDRYDCTDGSADAANVKDSKTEQLSGLAGLKNKAANFFKR